jgi:toxin HigB-1
MIRSYRDRTTERFAAGDDLAALNSNRFEGLRGDRQGIRINDRWRICFQWPPNESGPSNVEIVDYH